MVIALFHFCLKFVDLKQKADYPDFRQFLSEVYDNRQDALKI